MRDDQWQQAFDAGRAEARDVVDALELMMPVIQAGYAPSQIAVGIAVAALAKYHAK